jgi:hypothetical protein
MTRTVAGIALLWAHLGCAHNPVEPGLRARDFLRKAVVQMLQSDANSLRAAQGNLDIASEAGADQLQLVWLQYALGELLSSDAGKRPALIRALSISEEMLR